MCLYMLCSFIFCLAFTYEYHVAHAYVTVFSITVVRQGFLNVLLSFLLANMILSIVEHLCKILSLSSKMCSLHVALSSTTPRMNRWVDRVALVTGAATGIGAGISRKLVEQGMIVVGCDKRLDKMEQLAQEEEVKSAPGKFHAIRCDLSKESEIMSMFSEIRSKFERLDVCINNAGFSKFSPLLSGETSVWRGMLEVNVLALCICSREAVKLMKEKNIDDGQIIQIGSVIANKMINHPEFFGYHIYCGTKSMVRVLTDGLRNEVKAAKTGIRVASITPSAVETEFMANASSDPKLAEEFFSAAKCLSPKDIADVVVHILQSPPHVEINDITVQPVEYSI